MGEQISSIDTMPNWLAKRADLTPDRIALITENEQWTFGQWNDRAMVAARQLCGLGIRPGASVGLLLLNGLDMPRMLYALQYAGTTAVMLNIRLTSHELAFQLTDAGVDVLIHANELSELAEELKQHLPKLNIISIDQLDALPDSNGELQTTVSLNSLHTIMYTSGTTGHPKGVMLTYGNHWWSAMGSALNLGLHLDDRWLLAVPMFHMSGLSILIRSVIYGISVVIHDRFDSESANRAILEQRITIMSVVSAMLSRMLDSLLPSQHDRYPASFRCMLLGGGPAPKPLLEACRDKAIPIYQTYGMTETASQIVTLSPEYMLTKLGSAGKPLFPAELRIQNEDGYAASGEIGEICVRGANVTSGYYRNETATAQTIANGWLRTGDLGYVDADGFLYVVDRRSDLIISGGENVYPAEIEAVLLAHPAIEEAGVVGMADERWGQAPVAFIKTRSGVTLTRQAVITYLSLKLARYKQPKDIHFVGQLPRNASSKLLRRELPGLLDGKVEAE